MVHPALFLVTELGPDGDPFIRHLFVAPAEKERAMIGTRTKAVLCAGRSDRAGRAAVRVVGEECAGEGLIGTHLRLRRVAEARPALYHGVSNCAWGAWGAMSRKKRLG
jgi:hypothetical protein